MNNPRILPLLVVQLFLLFNNCIASNDTENTDAFAQSLLSRFTASKKIPGFLRKLVSRNMGAVASMREEFGPGADWSCTAASNAASDFDSCTMSAASKLTPGGCSWCPLGSNTGVCLRAGQAAVINSFENDELLHLHCYADDDDIVNESGTSFWDEVMSCLTHSRKDCAGDHGDHKCTYCSVGDPEMGLCLSEYLWDNLVIAKTLEDFDRDVPTSDQIQLDEVVQCYNGKDEDEEFDSTIDDNIWSTRCGGAVIDDVTSEEDCFVKEECAVATNIFPGLFGSNSGMICVTNNQQRAMAWAMKLLRRMGWEDEMKGYLD